VVKQEEDNNRLEEGNDDGVFSIEGSEDTLLSKSVEEAVRQESEGDSIQLLRKAVEQKTSEAQKASEKYLYLLAEFENYKKRVQKEQVEQARFSNTKLLKEMIVVLDNLERAVLHAKETPDFVAITTGLDLVVKQFLFFLSQQGVTPIDSLSRPFDPAYHQAVGYLERAGCEKDQVVEEVQKGYMLHDRVLRASMVLIAKEKTGVEEGGPSLGGSVDRSV